MRVHYSVRAVCLLLLVLARVASAAPQFTWTAPATCPDGDDVRARIEQRLGAPLAMLGVAVEVTRDGTTFVARIDTRAITVANGARVLRSARCDELADAVAVVIARLATEHRAATVTLVAHVEAPRPALRRVLWVRDPPPHAPPRFGYGVHVMALSGIGTVPRVGVGAELSVFGRRKQLFAEVGFARWASRSAYLVDGAPGRVDVGLDVATARFGWSPTHMPLRAWIGAEVGAMRGQGAALDDARGGSAPWLAITSGFSVGWPMSRYARLLGTFEVAVPTSRVAFTLAQGGDIYTSSSAAARCALGLELGLP